MSNEGQPRDHAPGDAVDDEISASTLEANIKSKATWLRFLFMLIFIALYFVSRIVLSAVVVLQFFWLLFSGAINEQLRGLGQSLAGYSYEIVRFLTFNTNVRPFPFDMPWPPSTAVEDAADTLNEDD
jgi:hypothetical protein